MFYFIGNAVPVRTASDQPYRLKKFKLRLFYASDIRQPNIEVLLLAEILDGQVYTSVEGR